MISVPDHNYDSLIKQSWLLTVGGFHAVNAHVVGEDEQIMSQIVVAAVGRTSRLSLLAAAHERPRR